jgi:transposase-like protein
MRDEFTARQRAITLRLSGRSVKSICSALGRSEFWFHKWWRRYLESGAEGLYDLTRANHQVAQRIPPSWSAPSSRSVGGFKRMPRQPPATA